MKVVVEKTEADAIPDDWETVPLGEVGTWHSGGTPSKSKESYWTGDIPWVSPKDMKQARLTDATDHISGEALGNGGKLAPKHAILIVVRGMILAHTFPVARIEREMAFNQDIKAVDTHDFIESGFLLWWLRNHSREFLKTATSASHGSKRISTESLFSQPIPVPPREEQEAIAEALSDVDALLASIDAAIEKKRNVKTATMQRLLTGEERLPGFEGEWEPRQLGGLVDIVNGGTPDSQNKKYWGGHVQWCTPTDITESSGKYLAETERQITEEGLSSSSAQLLPAGALLLCSRATVGEVKIASREIATNQGFKSLVCGPEVDNHFLYYVLLTKKKDMIRKSYGSTFLEMSKRATASLEITLPSLEEQRAIAEVLADMDAEIEAWETRRAKTEAVKTGMMQELLTGKTRLG